MRRFLIALGWLVIACVTTACPEDVPKTMSSPDALPTADLSVDFSVQPSGRQVVSTLPQTLTYRVIVNRKGVLNAGVQFETENVKAPVTATVSPARISETAQETELVVQFPAGTRPDDYDFTLRARLTVSGRAAESSTPTTVPVRVASGEGSFSLTCPAELAIPAGGTMTMPCRTIRDSGFSAIIDLSFANRPGNITIIPETVSVGPDAGGFAFTVTRVAAPTATPSFVDLVTVGRSGSLTRQSTTRILFP